MASNFKMSRTDIILTKCKKIKHVIGICLAYCALVLLMVSCDRNKKENAIKSIVAQETINYHELLLNDRNLFIDTLTSHLDSDAEKTEVLINWLSLNLEWKATDYKNRTVDQIIARGGGNCNDLAKLTMSLLDSAKIKMRKIREINLHIKSEKRQQDAEKKIAEKGFKYSVFGKIHNDHVWIEVFNKKTNKWIPADPSLGLAGLENWIKGRVIFNERKTLDPLSEDMIIPIAIFAQDSLGNFTENRTEYYLIKKFNETYEEKLSILTNWNDWVEKIKKADDYCLLAFKGEQNLHEYQADLEAILQSFLNLKSEYQSKKSI